MGTNCASLFANLFLFHMMSLSDNTQAGIIDAFNTTSDEDLTPQGWGRYSQVFLHVDLDQASTVYTKNIRSIRHSPKNN